MLLYAMRDFNLLVYMTKCVENLRISLRSLKEEGQSAALFSKRGSVPSAEL